jgi:hypothetical protein
MFWIGIGIGSDWIGLDWIMMVCYCCVTYTHAIFGIGSGRETGEIRCANLGA